MASAAKLAMVAPVTKTPLNAAGKPNNWRSIEIASGVAQRVGVTIYAIGLGTDVRRDVLESITRDPNRVYLAPTAADLEAIYEDIARTIPCR